MKHTISFSLFAICASGFFAGCSVDPTDASVQGGPSSANAGKVLVENAPCDVDIFISTEQTRCVEYRSGNCRDYIFKGGKIEDRGEFACTFNFVSSNAEKKDRTRIKLTGGTLKFDVNFLNGFQDSVCNAKTSSDMQVGTGRWVFWRPDQGKCAAWAGKVSVSQAADANPTLPDASDDPIPGEVILPTADTPKTSTDQPPVPPSNQGSSGAGGSGSSDTGSGGSSSNTPDSGILSGIIGWIFGS